MQHPLRRSLGVTVAVLALFTAGTVYAADNGKQNIAATAQKAGNFETLLAAAKAAGLAEALTKDGPFTVFAPTDNAFAKLPEGTVEALLNDVPKLKTILSYHVVPETLMAKDVVARGSLPTLLGQSAKVDVGEGVMIGGAKVVQTDIACSNGVIHVVDSVMMPADIVDLAVGSGKFNTLVAAVKTAGLVETLKGDGPFTVFAPTDDAFAKLPSGTVESLLKPENRDKLTAILTYHVVPGRVMASDVMKMKSAKTVQGQSLTIMADTKSGSVNVDGANVTQTDIQGLNGVIHVIDEVILPKE